MGARPKPSTILLLDGDLKLYRRAGIRRWQATFRLKSRWVRVSTGHHDIADATIAARELLYKYRYMEQHGLPTLTKSFRTVAMWAMDRMREELDNGVGKKSFRDYGIVINRYLIPYFDQTPIHAIRYDELQKFGVWRRQKMGREPKSSTLNTHNSALNRVFDEAVMRGLLARKDVPVLANKGRNGQRRPDFTQGEFQTMLDKFPDWIAQGRAGKSRQMRELLFDYVVMLANTGMRHGTETQNLCWRHVTVFEDGGRRYVELSVSGKTGRRDLICREGTIEVLQRIQARSDDIAGMNFERLLAAKLDLPMFRLGDGTVSLNLRQTFKAFLTDFGLLECPRTGQQRTLYSLRHTYATLALLNDGMDVHTLARQMGTSIAMIERHYSHLTPRLRKDLLAGTR
jgi:integrase